MITTIFNPRISDYEIRELTPEEIEALSLIPEHQIPYEQKVVSLIRERYTIDDELAINRQKETKPDEWQEYFEYCEWCKAQAKT